MNLRSWGNYPNIDNEIHPLESEKQLSKLLKEDKSFICYGNGRSYGDSSQSEHLITTQAHHYMLDFDSDNGILHCQAGVLLSEIISCFLPRGWFLSVSPGTKYVTVGGAIASDVHGKNQHVAGSFSDQIIEFEIMQADGRVVICSHTENTELFQATCGGMGLTGVVLNAKIKLIPVNSANINQITIKTKNLRDTFDQFEEYASGTYFVAWIDGFAKGKKLGRGVVTIGEHANDGMLDYQDKQLFDLPLHLPDICLNPLNMRIANELIYHKEFSRKSQQVVGIDSFFYPLDAIGNWNRAYGKNGFIQYQFVLPLDTAYEGMIEMLTLITQSKMGSIVAVLKRFGKGNDNWLSFPMEGYFLAIDFKISKGIFELIAKLDEILVSHQGRIYLAKDSCVSKQTFEAGYPHINKFRVFREASNMPSKFSSLQSRRLEI